MQPISARLRRISRRKAALAAATVAGLALTACGSSTSSSSAAPAASDSSKALNIAYLSFAVEDSYDAPMLAAAQAVASDNHATMKVFDANNNPQTQYAQLQDVISSGQYNGIILQPIFGTGLTGLVKEAISKGIKVVNMDQILGPNLATDAPQVPGLSANVTFVPTEIGTKLGTLVVQACQAKNLNPCKGRLPLRHQGLRAGRRDLRRVREGDRGRSRRQDRRAGAELLQPHHRAHGGTGHADGQPGPQPDRRL